MILVVDGQRIYNYEYQEPPPIATNSLGFIDIEFRLSEEWNGHICTAQFVQHKAGGPDFVASKVLYNNHVTFPDGIVPGVLEISLFGYKAGEAERGTTFPYFQPVYRSGFTSTEATPIPPTPDLYAQLLAQFQQGGQNAGIHIGPEEPEDESVVLWVDTDEEGGSGGGIDEGALLETLESLGLIHLMRDGDNAALADADGAVMMFD